MTLHLTGCWLPGVNDETTSQLADSLENGELLLVWATDDCALPHLNRLCADALRRMAAPVEEPPHA